MIRQTSPIISVAWLIFGGISAAMWLNGCATAPPVADTPPMTATDKLAMEADKFAGAVDKSAARPHPIVTSMPPPEVVWENPGVKKPGDAKDPATPNGNSPAGAAATAEKTADDKPAKPKAEMSTAELIKSLNEKLKHEKLGALKPYLERAALSMIDPQFELTESDLADLGEDDRKIVLAYQHAFTALGKSLGSDAAANKKKTRAIAEELLAKIDGQKQLAIRNAKLCTKVNGFGVYSVFESNTFLAGKEQPMIVYAELDHFGTAMEDDQNVVRLTQQITLYNDVDGLAVWKVKPTQIIDRSRNKRRDFFVVQIIGLPSRLTVGKYQLKLSITDEVGQAEDEVSIPIQIVADNQLAGGGADK